MAHRNSQQTIRITPRRAVGDNTLVHCYSVTVVTPFPYII